jgi:cytosine/adenosine deaminase-related metal-dependent hydrolase
MERVVDWHESHPQTRVQIHLAETEDEAIWAYKTHAMSTTAVCDMAGLLKSGTIAAHCLLMDDANTLDLFSQFGVVSIFAKVLGRSRKSLPTRDVIRMATIEGAKVLGLDAEVGSLEIGKTADLIRVDLSAPRLQPIYDPYSLLVFAAMPTDVQDVMVDGAWLMRDRAVETLERARVLADANQVAEQFRAEIVAIDAALVQKG